MPPLPSRLAAPLLAVLIALVTFAAPRLAPAQDARELSVDERARYAAAIAVSLFQPWIAHVLYIVVALIWLIPDRRIERVLYRQG